MRSGGNKVLSSPRTRARRGPCEIVPNEVFQALRRARCKHPATLLDDEPEPAPVKRLPARTAERGDG
jgi:hypothetical protein